MWWDLSCPTCKHPYEGKAAVDLGSFGLAQVEQEFGSTSPEAAAMMTSLANAEGHFGDVKRKQQLYLKAVDIYEAAYGPNHRELAVTLANLACTYGDVGEHQRKKHLLERVISIEEAAHGPNSREAAIVLVNLGNAYGDLGNANKMKALLERALKIFKAEYLQNRREVAMTLSNLGGVYGDLGDAKQMKELLEEALNILEAEFGPNHEKVIITLVNLALAHAALGSFGIAKEFATKAQRTARLLFPFPSAVMSDISLHLSGVYRAMPGDQSTVACWDDATRELRASLGMRDARSKLLATLRNFSSFWAKSGRSDVAEWLTTAGAEVLVEWTADSAQKRRRLTGKQRPP